MKLFERNKPVHYTTDNVELLLEHTGEFYFSVSWRFVPVKCKRKFLWWEWEANSREKWHQVMKYSYPDVSLKGGYLSNPYDDGCWKVRLFFVGDKKSMDSFSKTVHSIKTYNDLDAAFGIERAEMQWDKDKKKYDELVNEFNERIKKGI